MAANRPAFDKRGPAVLEYGAVTQLRSRFQRQIMPDSPITPAKKPVEYMINPEADRRLRGIMLRYIIGLALLLPITTILFSLANVPHTSLFRYHIPLDYLSALILIVPLYAGVYQIFNERLTIARDLSLKREWKQVVAALEPFDTIGQKWLDRTGEAHYLLAQAHNALKNGKKAEACRQFVLKHRPGEWATKLGGKPATGTPMHKVIPQQPRPRPPKSGPKRRF